MDIVEEIRANREEGAKRLVLEYKSGLLTLANRFCHDAGDAEELVNRTFAEVVSRIDDYAERAAFFGWMCQILANLHSNDTRRRSYRNEVFPGEVPDKRDDDAQEAIFRHADHSQLREAIEELPAEMRKAVVLHYFVDMPVREVARVLSTPTGTVAWRLHQARDILAAKLGAAAQKPWGKAPLLALALCGFAALGAGVLRLAGGLATAPAGRNPEPEIFQPEKETTAMKSRTMAIPLLAAELGILAGAGDATYVPVRPEGGIFDWRTVGNWYDLAGNALGALPGEDDDIRVTDPAFAQEWLVLPAGAEASVRSLYLQHEGLARGGAKMKIDGGKLTTSGVSYVGHQGGDALLSVENGGDWTAEGKVVVGYGGAENCQLLVDSSSSFSGTALDVQNGGGKGASGSLVARVANDGDFALTGDARVGCRENRLGSDHESRIDNGGTFAAGNLHLGRAPETRATFENRRGGSVTVRNAYVGACTNATGVLVNDGTFTATAAFAVGDASEGQFDPAEPAALGVVTNRGTIATHALSFAYKTNSVARMRNEGTVSADFTGAFSIGREPGSDGELANYGTLDLASLQVNVGHSGRGRLEIGADTTLGRIFAAAASGGRGEICVTNGAVLATTDGRVTLANAADACAVLEVFGNSSLTGVTNLVVGESGSAALRLHGGSVILSDGVGSLLHVGRDVYNADASNGRLEGWGTVGKTDPSASTGKATVGLHLYNGVVSADGGGEARDLDLRLVQDLNRSAAAANSCGTNGWYAVNGARLRYPSRFHSSGTSRIVGDFGGRAVTEAGLPLVNSFGLRFATSDRNLLANRFLYADLYAPDRADIPAGLPEPYPGVSALGVWRATLSGNANNPEASRISFGSAELLVHYDVAALAKTKRRGEWPGNMKLLLLAHDGTATGGWRKIAAETPCDSPFVSGTLAESGDVWNLGWFAIVPVKIETTCLIVR